jgi:beta-glucosidase-like glycosyl hydrolase
MRERGKAIGSEFVGKGANIVLGPDVNMARIPQGMIIKGEKPRKAC